MGTNDEPPTPRDQGRRFSLLERESGGRAEVAYGALSSPCIVENRAIMAFTASNATGLVR